MAENKKATRNASNGVNDTSSLNDVRNDSVNIADVLTQEVTSHNIPIDYDRVTGFPKTGVQVSDVTKRYFKEYDPVTHKAIPGSEDRSRPTKLIFKARNLDTLNALKASQMDPETYATIVSSIPSFEVVISGESDVHMFQDLHPDLMEGLQDKYVFDIVGTFVLSALWSPRNPWTTFGLTMKDYNHLDITKVG